MRRYLGLVVSAFCCLGLVSCSSNSTAGDPPTSGTTTSAATSPLSPSASPTSTSPHTDPAPPRLPALAKERSTAGAKAFVRYYISALNHAWLSQSTNDLQLLAASACQQCARIGHGIDDIRLHHGDTRGATWGARSLVSIPAQPRTQPVIHVAIATRRGAWKPSSKVDWRPIHSSVNQWDVHLNWQQDKWIVARLEVQ